MARVRDALGLLGWFWKVSFSVMSSSSASFYRRCGKGGWGRQVIERNTRENKIPESAESTKTKVPHPLNQLGTEPQEGVSPPLAALVKHRKCGGRSPPGRAGAARLRVLAKGCLQRAQTASSCTQPARTTPCPQIWPSSGGDLCLKAFLGLQVSLCEALHQVPSADKQEVLAVLPASR